ncbi:hypothetical protein DPMN_031383 [Dreissena polymorpha]|uniref:Uncharacterized protein n=1 Tax=Dreissena polymorpha TaxID=45954 RepID=A0A9D4M310_DREPO|nr:hypothetical protein DPMN_031383 [Dreissena polymorpha]
MKIHEATKGKCPAPGGHIFQATGTIFELVQDIIGTNLLTMIHDDRARIMASRTNLLTKFNEYWTINVASRVKNTPPTVCHVFKATETIFKLIQDIIGTNVLTNFHEYRKINVASRVKKCPALWQPLFSSKLIIGTNLLTKFHDDWTINVASRVLTRQMLTPHDARRTKGDHKSSP